jgi:CheY-like chemotaxis protein
MELRCERILLSDVISSALETARPLIDEGKHELNVSLPQRPVHLYADLTRLAQVFSNLLTNSTKYTPQGGRIWLSAERSGEKITVSVRDTGIGIPAESLENIFDMFSQVDRSIERTTGGLGIGLALVKGLVEMHGGDVIAKSRGPGMGSTFSVTLPTLAGHAEPTNVIPAENKTIGPGLRILVVDDNRDGAASLSMMLKMLGNEVRTAYDGLEAIERAEDFRPEIILMDVGMPRLNGYEATKQIRGLEWGKDIIIVALTGWGQERDRELSRAAGCNGHLVKPVSLPDLERKLTESKNT